MARHMTEGGKMGDQVGKYIVESVAQLGQIASFMRYAKSNKLINEDTNDIIATVMESMAALKSDIAKLTSKRTYESTSNRVKEQSAQITLQETDDDLRDKFTSRHFDERFDTVLPLVSQIVQEKNLLLRRIEEAAQSTIYITASSFDTNAILEFNSPEAKLGSRLSDLAIQIIENEELATFVGKAGQSLSRTGEMSVFEKSVVANVLQNITESPDEEIPITINETASFAEFYDKYNYTFV